MFQTLNMTQRDIFQYYIVFSASIFARLHVITPINYYMPYAYVVFIPYLFMAETQCNFNLLTMQYDIMQQRVCMLQMQ